MEKHKRPWRSIIAKTALILAGLSFFLVLASCLAFIWVLHNLDHHAIKSRIIRAVREDLGVAIDYERIDLSLLEGLVVEGFMVETPEPFRAFSPAILSVRTLEIRWDPASVLVGPMRIPALSLSGIRIVIVQDEEGRSSLGEVLSALPKPEKEKPKTPLSQGLAIKGLGLDINQVEVSDIVMTRLFTKNGEVVRSETLEGLEIKGQLHAGRSPETASLTIGSEQEKGIRLSIKDLSSGVERLATVKQTLVLTVLDPYNVRLEGTMTEVSQNFLSEPQVLRSVFSIDAGVTFKPEESIIEIHLQRFVLGDDIAIAGARVSFHEKPKDSVIASISKAELDTNLGRLFERFRQLFPAVRWQTGNLRAGLSDVEVLLGPPYARIKGQGYALLTIPEVWVEYGPRRIYARGLEIRIEVPGSFLESVSGAVSVRFKVFRLREGPRLVTVRDGNVVFKVEAADVQKILSFEPSGAFYVDAKARMASVRTADGRARLGGVGFNAEIPLRGNPPFAVSSLLSFEEARWIPTTGAPMVTPRGRIQIKAQDIVPDETEPARSSATVTIAAQLGDMFFSGRVSKETDNARFDFRLGAQNLAVLAPFVEKIMERTKVPLATVAFEASLNGQMTRLFAPDGPSMSQTVTVNVSGLQGALGGHRVEVPYLAAQAKIVGIPSDLELKGGIETKGVRIDGRLPLRLVALVGARWHKSRPEGRLQIEIFGQRHKMVDANLEAQIFGAERAVAWRAVMFLRELSGLATLLPLEVRPKIGVSKLDIEISTAGRINGVFERSLKLVSHPLRSAKGEISAAVRIRGLGYFSERTEFEVDEIAGMLKASGSLSDWGLKASVAFPKLRLDQRVRTIAAEDGQLAVDIKGSGDPREGEMEVRFEGRVGSLAQDIVKTYRVGEAALAAKLRISRLDTVRVDEFSLINEAGGTRLKASVALDELGHTGLARVKSPWDLIIGRRSMVVSGTLEQRLEALPQESFKASGKIVVPFTVESGDRSIFRVSAAVKADRLNLQIPGSFSIAELSGTVPIEEEFALMSAGKPILVFESDRNLFSRVRFQDQHPFLRTDAFVSAKKVEVGPFVVGPLAGNLRIRRNVFSLDQLEAVWKQGKVSGQLVVEWDPKDSRVSFRGKMTGIKPEKGEERLDANAAIDFSLGRREVGGRIHFVRIGRGHLMELLDICDPYHENVALNRIRKALKLGYPRYARVRLDGGFLSAKVELGGLGTLVRIDEVRGIPTGPLLRRFLGEMIE